MTLPNGISDTTPCEASSHGSTASPQLRLSPSPPSPTEQVPTYHRIVPVPIAIPVTLFDIDTNCGGQGTILGIIEEALALVDIDLDTTSPS